MLFLVCPIYWSSFMVLWASDMAKGDNIQDICQVEMEEFQLNVQNSSFKEFNLELTEINEIFTCHLYPTNLLNCSWSFLTLKKDTQLSVYISVCDEDTAVQTLYLQSEEIVGSHSLTLHQYDMLYVILQFNMSQHDKWKVYSYKYDMDTLEVLSPPSNVSATIKDGGLLVRWGVPQSQSHPECFEYQLDLGGQEAPKQFSARLSYTEHSADPSHAHRVRMRTRKLDACIGSAQWSEWSPTVTLEQSAEPVRLNTLLIISLLLFGIPMILLAVMLLVHHLRVSELLFPPIPRPPPEYKDFLERNGTFSVFHPALSSKAEEEITKVEDTEENPGEDIMMAKGSTH